MSVVAWGMMVVGLMNARAGYSLCTFERKREDPKRPRTYLSTLIYTLEVFIFFYL